MAKLGISTGSAPNDGTGDSLLDGAVKVNTNFTEIYTAIGDGTTLAVPVTSVSAGTGINVSGSTGNVTITNTGIAQTANINADTVSVSGVVTATSFVGSGANITGISTLNIVNYSGGGGGSGVGNTNNLRTNFLEVSGISTFQNAFFINPSSNTPATLQVETGAAGVGNTIRSSNSLDLRTNGSAFSVNLGITSAILASGTGASQYTTLYGQGSEKLKTAGYGVTVTGTAYATQFVGSGANITGISTLNIVNYSGGGGGSGVGNTNNIRTNFLEVSGISTFNGNIQIPDSPDANSGRLNLGNSSDLRIYHDGTDNHIDSATNLTIRPLNFTINGFYTGEDQAKFIANGPVELYYDGVKKFETTASGVDINGNLNVSSNITVGAAGSISGDASYAVSGKWDLGADGTNNYTFTGIGFPVTTNDPDLYLARGAVYEFVNGMGAHPFRIQSTANGSTGTQYNTGVTNNDVSNGTLKFEVPFSAPDTLYYQCTAHAAMGGKLYIYPTLR